MTKDLRNLLDQAMLGDWMQFRIEGAVRALEVVAGDEDGVDRYSKRPFDILTP